MADLSCRGVYHDDHISFSKLYSAGSAEGGTMMINFRIFSTLISITVCSVLLNATMFWGDITEINLLTKVILVSLFELGCGMVFVCVLNNEGYLK